MSTNPPSPEPFELRPERPDQPDVVRLLAALDAYLASLYASEDNHILSVDELVAQRVHFVVARYGGRAVGCGAVRRMPGETATQGVAYGEIKRMMVEPSMRGRGLGVALLAALERQLVSEGLHLALLETGAEQTQAVRLYEAQGYRRRGPFGGYPDNGLSLFFAKALSA